MTSWVDNNFIGYDAIWDTFFETVSLYSSALFSNCKLRRWLFIGGNHRINEIGEFLQFSSKRKGITEIRKFQNDDQKNMTILMVPKSQWLWQKKWNKIGPGSLKGRPFIQ